MIENFPLKTFIVSYELYSSGKNFKNFSSEQYPDRKFAFDFARKLIQNPKVKHVTIVEYTQKRSAEDERAWQNDERTAQAHESQKDYEESHPGEVNLGEVPEH